MEWQYGDDSRLGQLSVSPVDVTKSIPVLFYVEPWVFDQEFHFAGAFLGDTDSAEYLHIDEDGPYKGFVFCNWSDDGTVAILLDPGEFDPMNLTAVYSDDAYEDVPTKTRIEWMPSFQNPVGRSLEEFFEQLTSK